jgi:hypothetical protein
MPYRSYTKTLRSTLNPFFFFHPREGQPDHKKEKTTREAVVPIKPEEVLEHRDLFAPYLNWISFAGSLLFHGALATGLFLWVSKTGNSVMPSDGSTQGDSEVFVPARAIIPPAPPTVPETAPSIHDRVVVPHGLLASPSRNKRELQLTNPMPNLDNLELSAAIEENMHKDAVLVASTNLTDVMSIVAGTGDNLEEKFGSRQEKPNSLEGRLYDFTRDKAGKLNVASSDMSARMAAMRRFFKSFVDEVCLPRRLIPLFSGHRTSSIHHIFSSRKPRPDWSQNRLMPKAMSGKAAGLPFMRESLLHRKLAITVSSAKVTTLSWSA